MNALITGITGMVGSHLADFLLLNTDWNIYGFQRWRSSFENISHLAKKINNNDRIFLRYGDLNDQSSLISLIEEVNPDFIFHLAAQSYPQTSFSSPLETLNTNILGTAKLLESVRLLRQNPVIHICASSEVFGRVSKENVPISENCSFHPASPYAISKVGTDLLGRYYAEAYKMTIMTTRMFTHTGPRRGDVFHESSFSKQIAMIEADIIPPVIKVGNLNSLRTYADVRDAVRAYYMLVTVNPIPGEVYNIGGSHTCTVGDTLSTLLSLSVRNDIEVKPDQIRFRPIDADLQVPDTTKFTNHTGWHPEIPYQQTMSDLLNYWRERVIREGVQLTR
ncbi:MAG: GDP-mannose 4,6-dehydratase [Deltaproteobacteria bacterium]|jgi:GDPmannose 4,6-dehydratase|nr:GDP-mannose 4,6-dehydratase [Deltaproteobacteria bacterium]